MSKTTPEQKAAYAAKERERRAADKAWLESLPEEERERIKEERRAADRARRKAFKEKLSPEEVLRRKEEAKAYDTEKYQRDKQAFLLLPVDEQQAIKTAQREKNKRNWEINGKEYARREKERFEALSDEEKAEVLDKRAAYQREYRQKNLDSIRERNRKNQKERGHIYEANRKAKLEEMSEEEREQLKIEAREYQQAYYYANKERILAQKKDYYQRNRESILLNKCRYHIDNREHRNAYCREYYEKNALELNEKSRKWYLENHDHCLKRQREWKKNNYEKARASEKACEHNRRKAPGKLTTADIQDAVGASEGRCPYCICELEFGKIHIDHVIPLSRGGHNTRDNIVACCEDCNLRKNDKTPREFVLGLRYEF
jgi:5-methylcytosine-specific restriction endonuclease McrA